MRQTIILALHLSFKGDWQIGYRNVIQEIRVVVWIVEIIFAVSNKGPSIRTERCIFTIIQRPMLYSGSLRGTPNASSYFQENSIPLLMSNV